MLASARLRTVTPSSGSTIYVSDTFTRADSSSSLGTADTGQAWTALAGTWGISSNKAYKVTASAQGYAVIDSLHADCTVAVTVSGASMTAGGGVTFRASDASNLWFVDIDGTGSSIYKNQTGSLTNMLSGMAGFTAGDVMSVVLLGTSIIVKKNGTQIGSLTNSFNSTATKHGLRDYTGTVRLDDFSARA